MANAEAAVQPLGSRDAIPEEATHTTMWPSPRTWWQKILYITCSTTTVEKEELAYSATPRDAAYCGIGGTLPMQRPLLINASHEHSRAFLFRGDGLIIRALIIRPLVLKKAARHRPFLSCEPSRLTCIVQNQGHTAKRCARSGSTRKGSDIAGVEGA